MKKDKHPNYQDVLFIDSSNGTRFVCGSTVKSQDQETFEGKQYPVVRLPITSASHPFFTGSNKLVDAEGRVKKFENRYEQAKMRTAMLAAQNEEAKKLALQTVVKPAAKPVLKAKKPVKA